jgi:hypothetical protein
MTGGHPELYEGVFAVTGTCHAGGRPVAFVWRAAVDLQKRCWLSPTRAHRSRRTHALPTDRRGLAKFEVGPRPASWDGR